MKEKELPKRLAGQAATTVLTSRGDKDEAAGLKLILILFGLLSFIGAEGIKVIYRTNFGVKAINMILVTICSLFFIGISILSFYGESKYLTDHTLKVYGSQSSFLITSIVYLLVAVYVFQKGISERAKANLQIDPYSNGNNIWFKFLTKEGWSERKIQTVAEPLFLISLGVLGLSYNILLGSPLIWCGVSLWIMLIVNRFWGKNHVEDVLDKKGFKENNPDSFSEVQS